MTEAYGMECMSYQTLLATGAYVDITKMDENLIDQCHC